MAATVTVQDLFKLGNRKAALVDILFDNSYPTNGEVVSLPITNVKDVMFEQKSGYMFEYDRANKKVKVYTPIGTANAHTHAVALDTGASAGGSAHTHAFTGTAPYPPLAVEETKAVTGNACTLSHLPLYIVAVHVTGGDVSGAFSIIPAGETPLTKQVAVNFTTGAMTFRASDNVSAAKVTYVPKRGSGHLSAVTVDEEIVASASKTNLAARAGLIQYVWDDTDGVLVNFEQPGAAPSATHFCAIAMNDGGATSVDSHGDDAGNTLKVTYVPYSQLPPGCYVTDADLTLANEAYSFTENHYAHVVVPGYGVNAIGETAGAARAAAIWEGPSGSAADGIACWNPAMNGFSTNQDTAMTIMTIPFLVLDTNQLTPPTPAGTNGNENAHTHGPGTLADAASASGGALTAAAASEVANEANLSTLTVRALVIGN